MRMPFSLALVLFASLMAAAHTADFAVREISAQVRSFALDSINLASPLDYYLSRAWVRATGKQKYWAAISTSKFTFDSEASDEDVDDSRRSQILDETIDRIIMYRDSVAALVTHTEGADYVLLNYCWIEDGRWVNGGQGIADDFDSARDKLRHELPLMYCNLPRISMIKAVPQDIGPFTDFLSGITSSPEQFLLDMLSSHKLVINGEYHRRKVSWDALKRLAALPGFSRNVGHVFLELPSWCQPQMDSFMASDSIDTDILLQIFREEQPNGWWDQGEFEFICDLWRLNRRLPDDEKIAVVLADYQIPYSKITERTVEAEDRNTHMADVIERTLAVSDGRRGSLFLVGCAHAYKSRQAGIASAAHGEEPAMTAGAQLAERLGSENVFTVFQHVVPGDNSGHNRTPVRGGIFDRAFEINGNRPVGFRLAGSPFGKEPFDGIYEIKYSASTGCYADNFDGYLFLYPVVDEPVAPPLTEIFTDEFVAEMKRRAAVSGTESSHGMWFGRTAPELTREYIIERLSAQ